MVLYCTIAIYFIVVYGITTTLLTKCCKKLEEKCQNPISYKTGNDLVSVAFQGVTAAALMIAFQKEDVIPFFFAFYVGACMEVTTTCLLEAIMVYKCLKKAQ